MLTLQTQLRDVILNHIGQMIVTNRNMIMDI